MPYHLAAQRGISTLVASFGDGSVLRIVGMLETSIAGRSKYQSRGLDLLSRWRRGYSFCPMSEYGLLAESLEHVFEELFFLYSNEGSIWHYCQHIVSVARYCMLADIISTTICLLFFPHSNELDQQIGALKSFRLPTDNYAWNFLIYLFLSKIIWTQ